METKQITTPSGEYTITIKTSITYGIRRAIQKAVADNMVYDENLKKYIPKGSGVYEAEEVALSMLVISIADKNGTVLTQDKSPIDIINSWTNYKDAEAVYNEINSIRTTDATISEEDKKK